MQVNVTLVQYVHDVHICNTDFMMFKIVHWKQRLSDLPPKKTIFLTQFITFNVLEIRSVCMGKLRMYDPDITGYF